jgi:hypothetical protein
MTVPCAIRYRGYLLAWRARLTLKRGEVVSYRIRYDWRYAGKKHPPALAGRTHNNEELTYWAGSWRSRPEGTYGRWLMRVIDSKHAVDGRDSRGNFVYLDGWFDLPGSDALCSLAISLERGTSSPVFSVDSGRPAKWPPRRSVRKARARSASVGSASVAS